MASESESPTDVWAGLCKVTLCAGLGLGPTRATGPRVHMVTGWGSCPVRSLSLMIVLG